jgi:trk system potassium uptake protein TrkA
MNSGVRPLGNDGPVYVIVVGAGEVGSYVAERLSREGHDVAVIERNAGPLRVVEDHLDVLTVLGNGTHPQTLGQAGVDKADLLVAVTDSDEVNMMASLVAKQAGVARTVIRIEAPELRDEAAADLGRAIAADLVIDPDEEAALDILELLEYPGASEVEVLAGGEVIVLGARLQPGAPLVGRTLLEVGQEYEPEWELLFGAISRDGETIIPRGNQRLEANDLLRVLCRRQARRQLAVLLGLDRRAPKRIMLLGGGHIAEMVASQLSGRGAEVVIVEHDLDRARELANELHRVTVLAGEITDADVLADADVGSFDVVVALTGEDDANILACLYAKASGAEETMAVVHRLSLLPLLSEVGIDAALSPRTATANGVLRFVRGGVAAVATFLEGEAEVLEVEVRPGTHADGAIVAELRLPKDVLIGAIVREGKAQIARGRSRLRTRDHVIVFAMPEVVDDVRRVFG